MVWGGGIGEIKLNVSEKKFVGRSGGRRPRGGQQHAGAKKNPGLSRLGPGGGKKKEKAQPARLRRQQTTGAARPGLGKERPVSKKPST